MRTATRDHGVCGRVWHASASCRRGCEYFGVIQGGTRKEPDIFGYEQKERCDRKDREQADLMKYSDDVLVEKIGEDARPAGFDLLKRAVHARRI